MKLKENNVFEQAKVINKEKYIDFLIPFLIVFLISSLLQELLIVIPIIFSIGINKSTEILNNEQLLMETIYGNNINFLIALFSTVFAIIVSIIYCTKYEKRPIESMGFRKKGILKNYLIGLIIGLIMFSSIVFIEVMTNSLTFDGVSTITGSSIVILILFFIGFLVQSASEEIMVRGYLLTSVGSKKGVTVGIVISSLVFGLMHMSNDGFTILPLINLILVGVFFALYYICTDNIWGVCAIHGIWNYAQGNIYGISVSGLPSKNSLFNTTQIVGKELINGGDFGAEGGLACTFILLVSLLALLIHIKNKKMI